MQKDDNSRDFAICKLLGILYNHYWSKFLSVGSDQSLPVAFWTKFVVEKAKMKVDFLFRIDFLSYELDMKATILVCFELPFIIFEIFQRYVEITKSVGPKS